MSKFKAAMQAIKERPSEEAQKIGKRRDPNYQQITAYLPQELYHSLKVALVQDKLQMSDLFSELVQEWLTSRDNDKK